MPTISPVIVGGEIRDGSIPAPLPRRRARPKSRIFTNPSRVTITLAAEIPVDDSSLVQPLPALQRSAGQVEQLAYRPGFRSQGFAEVMPSMSFIATYATESDSPTSRTETMFGWFSAEAAFASRVNRAR